MEALWGIITIVGPFLLLGVIIWAWASNRKRRAATIRQAEAGAARIYGKDGPSAGSTDNP